MNETISPVFILGINPRSGTNYLFQLLCMHPDCIASRHYGEDFIISCSDMLLGFINKVGNKWASEWNNNPEILKKCMEEGIVNYLNPGNNQCKYVITKTPDATNAHLFLELFSTGKLILITRKGQDLTESFIKTFKSRFDDAVRGWNNGAKAISQVLNNKEMMNSGRVICIKYEDLYQKNKEVMVEMLEFLNLDVSKYDFSKSENFDVIGSSTFKGDSKKVTWDPIAKNKAFNPLNRFAHWSRFKHYRFNWLAGKYSEEFGYELYFNNKGPFYFIYNFILMIYDFIYRTIRRVFMNLQSYFKK